MEIKAAIAKRTAAPEPIEIPATAPAEIWPWEPRSGLDEEETIAGVVVIVAETCAAELTENSVKVEVAGLDDDTDAAVEEEGGREVGLIVLVGGNAIDPVVIRLM